MSAAPSQSTVRWTLRCLLAFCLSAPIMSAIFPVRWDYPSTLDLARSHGLSILKHSSYTSSVRSSDTSSAPIAPSDDRASIVNAFLRMGFARFNLLNGVTTESVVGSPINFFSARLLRDLGLADQSVSVSSRTLSYGPSSSTGAGSLDSVALLGHGSWASGHRRRMSACPVGERGLRRPGSCGTCGIQCSDGPPVHQLP